MKQLTIVKMINALVVLVGIMAITAMIFEAFTGYHFLAVMETVSIGVLAIAVPAAISKGKKQPNFYVEERVSETSGRKYIAAVFSKEYWTSLSLVKKAILRANFLQTYNFKGFWLVRAIKDLETAEATLNSLTLDKRSKVEELNEPEAAVYTRLKEKEENKGQRKAGKGKVDNSAAITAILGLNIPDVKKAELIAGLGK